MGDFVARKAGVVVLLVVWIVGIGSFCARPTHFFIVTPSVRRVASVARTVVITVQDLLLREAGRVVEVALPVRRHMLPQGTLSQRSPNTNHIRLKGFVLFTRIMYETLNTSLRDFNMF